MPPEPPLKLNQLAVVIPTLNERDGIRDLLLSLAPLRDQGAQIVVVDGESTDDTVARLGNEVDQVLVIPKGRARQMNAGAKATDAQWLWFLHADSRVTPMLITEIMQRCGDVRAWACCDVWIEGQSKGLKVIGLFMNLRSRLSGIATGDQGLLIHRQAFVSVGGFLEQPLMEDVAMSAALRRQFGRPQRFKRKLGTSGRRWEVGGLLRTQLRMWWVRWLYWRGVSPSVLAAQYRPEQKG
ncbi:glycosyltransferase [Spiribacter sp. C176]|uniref:Glycosyltransferase n=1 Tax=Spiribacter salilacus TaxID=2664894 RepID=A0A6N7QM20_9GAMM|nr:TIGR04283 family arsenosugar biosynthesis glycosyltransferase [Spiribacter salilacus]MRH77536.1 glycosyltransferase [Spiribacter salilacus]